MRTLFSIFLQFILLNLIAQEGIFDQYFTGERLRFDFSLEGNAETIKVEPGSFLKESHWGGSQVHLMDTFLYGELVLKMFNSRSDNLIYSIGFSHLIKEWQTTSEADTSYRRFGGSIIMPFPKEKVRIEIHERNKQQQFENIFAIAFNPDTDTREINESYGCYIYDMMAEGDPSNRVDIAVVGEGYTRDDSLAFVKDFIFFGHEFYKWEPYQQFKELINLWGILAYSDQSGTDNPNDSIWSNTILNTSFNTFGSDRYLTIPDLSVARDLLTTVPYEHIVVMVNTDKYGGGGIYNQFAAFASGHSQMGFLFHHEFGHSFAGLGDEYYSSEVAYNDFIDTLVEPFQPNLTTLIDFKSKWSDLIADSIPLPTPDIKEYNGALGVFEGGSYMAKGVYRPMRNCSMRTRSEDNFCVVCKMIIQKMIQYYSE